MFLLSLVMSAPPCEAGEIFTSVSEGYETVFMGHNWNRSFPREVGWDFLHAAGGDYNLAFLDEDLQITDDRNYPLTGRSDLIDHGIARCPDGGALHASFSGGNGDTQHTFRYDSDWNLLAANQTVSDDIEVHASDPPVLCSALLNATALGYGFQVPFRLSVLDDDGALLRFVDLPTDLQATGASLMVDAESNTMMAISSSWVEFAPIAVNVFSLDDFSLVDARDLDTPQGTERRAFWPQGLMKIGDHYLLGYIVTGEAQGKRQDEGDVWLSAFDLDWNHVETVEVIAEPETQNAYFRVGLSRKGNTILVTYDHINRKQLSTVKVDLVALGAEGGDTGLPYEDDTGGDTGDSGDSGGDGPFGDGEGCGCTTATSSGTGTAGLGGLLALVGWRRRRGG